MLQTGPREEETGTQDRLEPLQRTPRRWKWPWGRGGGIQKLCWGDWLGGVNSPDRCSSIADVRSARAAINSVRRLPPLQLITAKAGYDWGGKKKKLHCCCHSHLKEQFYCADPTAWGGGEGGGISWNRYCFRQLGGFQARTMLIKMDPCV